MKFVFDRHNNKWIDYASWNTARLKQHNDNFLTLLHLPTSIPTSEPWFACVWRNPFLMDYSIFCQTVVKKIMEICNAMNQLHANKHNYLVEMPGSDWRSVTEDIFVNWNYVFTSATVKSKLTSIRNEMNHAFHGCTLNLCTHIDFDTSNNSNNRKLARVIAKGTEARTDADMHYLVLSFIGYDFSSTPNAAKDFKAEILNLVLNCRVYLIIFST